MSLFFGNIYIYSIVKNDKFLFVFIFLLLFARKQDKPWVFAHLLQLQRRHGKDAFPLIDQTFFPNAHELVR